MWNLKVKVITVRIGSDGNHFKIIRTIPEQYTWKARNYGTTNNRHIAHCTNATESANVKVQTYFTDEIALHVAQIVNTEQLQHYTAQKYGLFQVCNCKGNNKDDDDDDDDNDNDNDDNNINNNNNNLQNPNFLAE